MAHTDALVDEVANEVATWPGVHVERRQDGAAVVRYEDVELGVLYVDRGIAELPMVDDERRELIEHGEAVPAEVDPGEEGVSHAIAGPSDVTAVLELFDRRYHDVRGADDPYSSSEE
jgi:Luciferase